MPLYACVIKLLALEAADIPPPGGQHAHAAFLDLVRAVDPALARRLHDLDGRKPFTVSPIFGLPRPARVSDRAPTLHLREGWQCWLRVTLLHPTLFHTLVEYFRNPPVAQDVRSASDRASRPEHQGSPILHLGQARFVVSEIRATPGSHPWAGFTTLDDLLCRLDQPPPPVIAFQLDSPTSFKLRDEQVEVIPYPKLVFGNLAAAWRALTDEDWVEAVEKYAEASLRLCPRRLERRALYLHNKPQIGMVGRVEYRLERGEDSAWARAINLLADLAFYTGLGRKTAQGMGMARRIPVESIRQTS